MITVIPFDKKYTEDFKQLNIEWLQQYFVIEPYDEYQLSHPMQEIIDKGGYIFLAKDNEKIIGTVALMKETGSSFELTKMSVTKESQGRGVSKLLMDACVRLAKEKNWNRLFLYSNTILAPAIQLYRRYGFNEIPLEINSHYNRTNIKMELKLANDNNSMDTAIQIIEYSSQYQPEFRLLNLEWLDKYNLTETHDLMVLDDPQGTILDRGGYIWLAMVDNKIIGSAALMKEHDAVYELAKMAVTSEYRGQGISKKLIETCLQKAKEIGAKKLTLFSNHQLLTALKLYEKYGFYYVEVEDSPFETADIKMELVL